MQIRKTVSLSERDENFIDGQIATGEYNNASEIVRAGLRLLEREHLNLAALRLAIVEGDNDIAVGRSKRYAPGELLSEFRDVIPGRVKGK